jgi:riboflavin biosynthesis pyrimidine reductase
MRQLFPVPIDDVDPLDVYGADQRPPAADRPWLALNMVASADGATAVDGVSGGLGGEGDRSVFTALRTVADVVLVASGTANAERYGPGRTDERRAAWRAAAGRAPTARIAVVTGSLSVDPGLPLFTDGTGPRPLVLTGSAAPAERRRVLEQVADVVDVGDRHVDLPAALRELRRQGAEVVLAEGGPSLNGQLVAEALVDELCLTLSPVLAGGDSSRIVRGAPAALRELDLDRVLEQSAALFLRYVRRPAS